MLERIVSETHFSLIPCKENHLSGTALVPGAIGQKSIFGDDFYRGLQSQREIAFVEESFVDRLLSQQQHLPPTWKEKEFIGFFTQETLGTNKVTTLRYDKSSGKFKKDYHFFTGGCFGTERPVLVRLIA